MPTSWQRIRSGWSGQAPSPDCVTGLTRGYARGRRDKALVGGAGDRCCLRKTGSGQAFEIGAGKRGVTRTDVEGQVGRVFQAAGAVLPPNWREHPA